MNFKKIVSLVLVVIMVIASSASLVFADDIAEDNEEYFELILYNDNGNVVQPRINADGSFTYSFKSRLHSRYFTATSDKIKINFKTSSFTNAYYYIALYDVTDGTINAKFKSMTQSKDIDKSDSKTFNVEKGKRYRFTFSKLNPKNTDLIVGSGTVSGIAA